MYCLFIMKLFLLIATLLLSPVEAWARADRAWRNTLSSNRDGLRGLRSRHQSHKDAHMHRVEHPEQEGENDDLWTMDLFSKYAVNGTQSKVFGLAGRRHKMNVSMGNSTVPSSIYVLTTPNSWTAQERIVLLKENLSNVGTPINIVEGYNFHDYEDKDALARAYGLDPSDATVRAWVDNLCFSGMACTLGHRLIWEKIAKDPSDTWYFVLEDDAVLVRNHLEFDPPLFSTFVLLGMHSLAYAITGSTAQKLLDVPLDPGSAPVDWALEDINNERKLSIRVDEGPYLFTPRPGKSLRDDALSENTLQLNDGKL